MYWMILRGGRTTLAQVRLFHCGGLKEAGESKTQSNIYTIDREPTVLSVRIFETSDFEKPDWRFHKPEGGMDSCFEFKKQIDIPGARFHKTLRFLMLLRPFDFDAMIYLGELIP